ncbi:AMP-binding protein [Candidatus Dependentiae bacterium]|nr:AMP-binding protein [Candidatus Dependentiae bacterium]
MGVVSRLKDSLVGRKRGLEVTFYDEIKERFSWSGGLLHVSDFLRRAFQMYSNNVALIGTDRTLTYKELYFRSLQVAHLLKQNGITSRDHVLLYCENSVEFYIFYYAIWLRGAVAVPINIFLHEKELAYIIKDSESRAILTLSSRVEKLEALSGNDLLEKLPLVLTEKDIDWSESAPCSMRSADDPFADQALGIDALALLLYTSGTTGVPKGVMLSSRNILTNSMQDYARLRMFSDERERFLAVLPLFHVFAQNTCMWLPLLTGSVVIVVPRIERRYILDGLRKKPTLFFGFPALYGLLCLMKTAPLESIKRFVSGADAMPDKIRVAFAMIYGRKICSGYGLTEAAPVIAINHDNESLLTNVVGRPVVGIDCEIRDDSGKCLASGEIGDLWVRGDNVMLGYYKAPEETAKVLKDGWLNTGDLASFDENGNLAIQGRSKDLIIHKGFNIYPQEVENVLMSHPAVFKAAVIGRNEAVVGQVPIAFIATRDDKDRIEQSLRALCSDNLASYKIPRKFICLDDLPMSPTGKIDKKQLQMR